VLAGGLRSPGCFAPAARGVLGTFLALNLLYSTWLKHVALVDVLAIALGFVLRVQAGIEGIGAPQSAWILLCMFFMALFLGFGKRRSEVSLMPDAHRHRRALGGYSVPVLDMLLGSSATTALVCYSLYAVTVQQNETFLLTLLPVVFAIARYMTIVLVRHGGEDPGEVLTRDGPLIASVLVWAVLCVAVLYFELRLLPDARVPRPPTFAR
jgi:4-hydroxybenzoate polyprenyltransferase